MPSTYSNNLRLNFQAPGDNLNTWGTVLNGGVFQLLEDAVSKRVAFTLSGSKTLTTANGATDEARSAFLDVTSGTGGTITIPAVEKLYTVRNAASGDVVVTTGGGATATIKTGETVAVVCDAANVRRVQATDMGGVKLTGLGAPVAGTDAATKAYADALAFNSIDLPGQGPGTVGAFLTSDGTSAGWALLDVTDVSGAAPTSAPSFTGGVTVAGGLSLAGGQSLTGSSKFNTVAVSGTSIDLAAGDSFTKSISANTTFTFANATASVSQAFILTLTISSSAVPTWPAAVKYPNGSNLSNTLGNGTHVLGFYTSDGGTSWVMVIVARSVA